MSKPRSRNDYHAFRETILIYVTWNQHMDGGAVAGKTSFCKRINTEWHSGPSQLSPYIIQSVDVSESSGVKLIPEALQEASHCISLRRNIKAFQVVMLFHIERIGRIGLDDWFGFVHLEVLNLHRNYGTR